MAEPMEVYQEKIFDITKLDNLYLLQLDNLLLKDLDIRKKISLCIQSCKDLSKDENIVIYSIIKQNDMIDNMRILDKWKNSSKIFK